VYTEQYDTLNDARKREVEIKKWKREDKQVLIASGHTKEKEREESRGGM